MSNEAKSKRLEKIEHTLSPKQWAIILADEIRRYTSQVDFVKAIAKGNFRQSPTLAPFDALSEQAQDCWPENNREHIGKRAELKRKLFIEFQALKTLIVDVNEAIKIRAETNKSEAAQQLFRLRAMILQDAYAHTRGAESMLASSAGLARPCHPSLVEDWADDSAMLLKETTAHKTAVQKVQARYFEGHPILFKNNEMAFEATIPMIRDAIVEFNAYRNVRANLAIQECVQEQMNGRMPSIMPFEHESHLPIHIEEVEKRAEMLSDFIVDEWVMQAKIVGTAEILRDTGEHVDYVWEQFRKKTGLKS